MLRYNNTIEDLIVFNQHHTDNSPAMKKMMNNSRIKVTAITLILLYLMAYQLGDMTVFYIGLGISVLYILVKPFLFKRSVRGNVKWLIKQGHYKSFVCEHKLYIEDNFLMESTEFERSGYRIDRLHSIIHTDLHCFIYIDEHRAHVIPKDHMTEGSLEEFITYLESLMQKNQN